MSGLSAAYLKVWLSFSCFLLIQKEFPGKWSRTECSLANKIVYGVWHSSCTFPLGHGIVLYSSAQLHLSILHKCGPQPKPKTLLSIFREEHIHNTLRICKVN